MNDIVPVADVVADPPVTTEATISFDDMLREHELSTRVRATGLSREELLEIEDSCGLLNGALAHLLCQKGHALLSHPTQER